MTVDDPRQGSGRPKVTPGEQSKAIGVVAQFLVMVCLVANSVASFLTSDQTYLGEVLNKSKQYVKADTIAMLFVFLHHIRLWMGINFISEDESFGSAVQQAYREGAPEVLRRERILRLLLLGSVGIFVLLANGRLGLWGLVSVFAIQSSLLVLYNVLFFSAMYRADQQRAANVFIAVGDSVIVVFTLLLACYAVSASLNLGFEANAALSMPVVFGALAAVFAGECVSQYWSSLVKLIRSSVE